MLPERRDDKPSLVLIFLGVKKGDAANSVRHGCCFVGRFGFRFVVSVEEPRLSIRVYCFHLETAQHESPH